jgi:UDP-3-O-[3-hydroxymyristoyl] glucosamine N-acyltransferase
MAEPVFFPEPAPLTIAQIADLTGARQASASYADSRINGVAALQVAGPTDVSFLENRRHADDLRKTKAGACFCVAADTELVPPTTAALITDEPRKAFAEITAYFFPSAVKPSPVLGEAGISPIAAVHPDAKLEPGVVVEAHAVIGPRAEIGRGTLIAPNTVIGHDVRIGRDSYIGPTAVVTHALLGDRVTIHAGACIGQDGFGFIPGKQGHTKIAQVGRVVIQDDVEIGANSTIDRGSNRDTIVGQGTKIDNLVQVGHNVVIGRNCLIAGQVGISGSVTIGDSVVLGGRVAVKDNLTIGNGAVVAGGGCPASDIPPGTRWGGYPAQPLQKWLREVVLLRQMTGRGGKKHVKKENCE